MKVLLLNGHNVRLGWVVILEETGEAVAHLNMRLNKARAIVERFNRRQRKVCMTPCNGPGGNYPCDYPRCVAK